MAKIFSGLLRDELTAGQMASVIELNRAETSRSICHSHDFCDANMTMARAFRLLGEDTSDNALWDAAWDAAKEAEFFVPGESQG
jgi:hypothetical protein